VSDIKIGPCSANQIEMRIPGTYEAISIPRLRLRIQPITPITCEAIIFAGDIESRRGSLSQPPARSQPRKGWEKKRSRELAKSASLLVFHLPRRGDIFLAPLLFGVQLRRRFTKSLSLALVAVDKNAAEQQQPAQYIIDDYLMRARLQSVSATHTQPHLRT
jgi:hypothetical protein